MVALATAFVRVRPDTRGFRGEADRSIGAQLAKAADVWAAKAGALFVKAFRDRVAGVGDDMPVGPTPASTTRQGEDSGGTFAIAFRKRIEAATRALPPVTIGVARDEAEQHLRDLEVGLAALSRKRVGVDLDARAAVAEAGRLKAQLEELAANSPNIRVRVDAAAAAAAIKGFTDKVRAGTARTPLGPPVSATRARGVESGGAFADAFRKRIDAALKALPPVTIGVARDEAEQHLRDLQTGLRDLSGKTIGVDLDAAAATAEAQRLKDRLDELARTSPNIQVRVDAAAATAQLAVLSRDLDREGERAGRSFGDRFGRGFSAGSGRTSVFGRVLAIASARMTLFAAAALAATPTVLHLTAALAPAAGAAIALPAAFTAAAAAVGTLKLATAGVGDAIKAGFSGDAEKAAEAVKKLPPAARSFTQSIVSMRGQLTTLRVAVSERFFSAFTEEVRGLGQRYLPLLQRQLPPIAASLGVFGENFARAAQQGALFRGLNATLAGTAQGLAHANDAVGPLTNAFGSLLSTGAPLLSRLGQGFADVATRAANFITTAAQTGQLSRWLEAGIATLKTLGQIVGNVGSIFMSVYQAANAGGVTLLDTIRNLTGQAAEFLRTAQGTQALQSIFATLASVGEALRTALGAVLPAIAQSLASIGPTIARLAPVASQLVVALAPLLPYFSEIAATLINALIPAVAALAGWLARNQDVLKVVASVIGGVVVAMRAWAVATTIASVATRLLSIALATTPVGWLIIGIGLLVAAIVLIATKTTWFQSIWKTVWGGLKAAAAAVASWFTGTIVPSLKDAWDSLVAVGNFFRDAWNAVWGGIQAAASAVADWFTGTIAPSIRSAFDAIISIGNFFRGVWDAVWGFFASAVQKAIAVYTPAAQIIRAGMQIIVGTIQILAVIARQVFVNLWGQAVLYAQTVWNVAVAVIRAGIDRLVGWFNIVKAAVVNLFVAVWAPVVRAAQTVWAVVVAGIRAGVNLLVASFTFWRGVITNVLVAVFGPIVRAAQAVWARVVAAMRAGIDFLVAGFNFWRGVVINVFSRVGAIIYAGWAAIRDNVFNPMRNFITRTIPDAFSNGVAAIGRFWEGLKNKAREPVVFVVRQVINPLINGFNNVAKLFGVSRVDPIQGFAAGGRVPAGRLRDRLAGRYAAGGRLPGTPSSRDNLLARGPGSAPIGLAGGEFVVNASDTMRALPALQWINSGMPGGTTGLATLLGGPEKWIRSGDGNERGHAVGGLVRYATGGQLPEHAVGKLAGFADGGFVGSAVRGSTVRDLARRGSRTLPGQDASGVVHHVADGGRPDAAVRGVAGHAFGGLVGDAAGGRLRSVASRVAVGYAMGGPVEYVDRRPVRAAAGRLDRHAVGGPVVDHGRGVVRTVAARLVGYAAGGPLMKRVAASGAAGGPGGVGGRGGLGALGGPGGLGGSGGGGWGVWGRPGALGKPGGPGGAGGLGGRGGPGALGGPGGPGGLGGHGVLGRIGGPGGPGGDGGQLTRVLTSYVNRELTGHVHGGLVTPAVQALAGWADGGPADRADRAATTAAHASDGRPERRKKPTPVEKLTQLAATVGFDGLDGLDGFATGGRIPGAPSRVDNILARGPGGQPIALATGEFIVNAKSTVKALPALEWINSGMRGNPAGLTKLLGPKKRPGSRRDRRDRERERGHALGGVVEYAAGQLAGHRPGRLTGYARGGILAHPNRAIAGYAHGGLVDHTSRSLAGYADGGLIGWVKKTAKNAYDAFTDPVGLLKKPAEAALRVIPGSGAIVGLLRGMGSKLVNGLIDWIKGKAPAGAAGPLGGGNAGSGVFTPQPNGWPPRRYHVLSPNTAAALRFIQAHWPGPSFSDHFRVGPYDHPWGKAIDNMANQFTPAGLARGDAIANWFISNPRAFGTKYVIWKKQVTSGSGWHEYFGDSDHRDHVHLSFFSKGGQVRDRVGQAATGVRLPVRAYDTGGWLPPGVSVAVNGTGRAEPVGQAGPAEYHFHFHGPVASKQGAQDMVLDAWRQLKRERKLP